MPPPPEDARRQLILEVLKARVEGIRIADGYRTNAGARVFLHEAPVFGDADPETAVAIVVQDDEVGWKGSNLGIRLPIEVQALARADLAEPWKAAERVLADLKQAIEQADRRFDGLLKNYLERGTTRTVPREPGTRHVGVGVMYFCDYIEAWGKPHE